MRNGEPARRARVPAAMRGAAFATTESLESRVLLAGQWLSAPTHLMATPANPSGITLAWDASPGADRYEIDRAPAGSGRFAAIGTINAFYTRYADNLATPAPLATYDYRVIALDVDDNASVPSATTTATAPLAVPIDFQVAGAWMDGVTFTWTRDDGPPITLEIERSTDQITYAPLASVSAADGRFVDAAVTEGTDYSYRVRAVNGSDATAWSNAQESDVPPTAPFGLAVLRVEPHDVTLTWQNTSTHAADVGIQRSDDGGQTWHNAGWAAASERYFDDVSVSDGYMFEYRVCAETQPFPVDAPVGVTLSPVQSWLTDTVEATTPLLPLASFNAIATGEHTVDITWTRGSASYYDDNRPVPATRWVEIDRNGQNIGSVAADAGHFVDTTAVAGTFYTYSAREMISGTYGTGDLQKYYWGDLVNCTTSRTPITPLGALTATAAGAGEVDLAWTPLAQQDDAGWVRQTVVYRSSDDGATFNPIAKLPAVAGTYVDRAVAGGQPYRYFLVDQLTQPGGAAIDSAPSARVGAATPAGASVTLQYRDKVIAVTSEPNATGDGAVVVLTRYNANGSLDATFGHAGRASTGLATPAGTVLAAVQRDGKLLVAGYDATGVIQVARYLANGTLDRRFGSGGTASVAFLGPDVARVLTLQRDGKILVAGAANDGWPNSHDAFALARLTAGGALDKSFGTRGIVVTPTLGASGGIRTLIPQPNGAILALDDAGDRARYRRNGTLDPRFH